MSNHPDANRQHDHHHKEGHHYGAHSHIHGVIDPSIISMERGIWAIKWSFVGLFVTALLQIVLVVFTGSVPPLIDQDFLKLAKLGYFSAQKRPLG